jgi:hypothetical protein
MTVTGTTAMNDEGPGMGNRVRRIALIGLSGLGAVFMVGVIAGVVAAHSESGDPVTVKLVSLLAAAAVMFGGLLWLGWRNIKALAISDGAPSRRERLNRWVLVGCGALGGLIAVAMMAGGGDSSGASGIFSNAPLPPALALGLAAIVLILMPAISAYWHLRVIDEQEAKAYGNGALTAFYTYIVGAPGWWLLWRGGWVPAPDGIAIYLIVIAVALIGWFWSKYR